ncbi:MULTISPECIES: hypothetical protein [unclassified Sphingopyxis]|uniref:hypothetical protein n=1 Tax=unclassified Sphingopyxis TaxID=2614943 RepID=UPI000A87C03C|nr:MULTISPECIES: hypothetical protein [unclassified Sphingopyxis]
MAAQREMIGALQAVHLISPYVGGDRAAKRAIVERLVDCSIKADCWWCAIGIDVGRPYVEPQLVVEWDEEEPAPVITDDYWHKLRVEKTRPVVSSTQYGDALAVSVSPPGMLGGAIWKDIKKSDLKRWDWYNGLIIVSYPAGASDMVKNAPQLPIRVFALGVRFAKEDILKIVTGSIEPQANKKSKKGGRKPSSLWPDWITELLICYHDTGFEGISANRLVEIIDTKLAEKHDLPLARSTAYPVAQAAIHAAERLLLRDQA